MSEAKVPGPLLEQHRENARVSMLGSVADWLEADRTLMRSVRAMIDCGVSPGEIRTALAGTAVANEIERLLAVPQLLQQIERVLLEAGVVLQAPDNQEELWLDVASLPLRGVVVSHADGGGGPLQPPDLGFMREVAEVAVPALYDAGYSLATLAGRQILPLPCDMALAEFSVSTARFRVLDADHSS